MPVTFTLLGAYEASWLCTEVKVSGGTVVWSQAGECDVQTAHVTGLAVAEPVARGETILLVATYPNGSFGVFGDGSRVQDDRGNAWEIDADHTPQTNFGYLSSITSPAWTKIYRCNVTTPLLAGEEIRVKGAVVMQAWKVNAKLLPYAATYTAAAYGDASSTPIIDDYSAQFLVSQGSVLEFGAVSHHRGHDGLGTVSSGAAEGYPIETLSLLGASAILDFAEGQRDYHEQIHSGPTPASPLIHDNLYSQWWSLWAGYREATAADVPGYYRFASRVDYTGITPETEGGIPLYPSSRAVAYYRILPLAGGMDLLQTAHGWLFRSRTEGADVLVERSTDAGASWPLSVTVASDADSGAVPTLAADAGENLWCWYHTADGEAKASLSRDLGASWEPYATHPNRRYPRFVRQFERGLVAAHDGTQLRFFASADDGETLEELLDLALPCPEQLAALRVDRRNRVHLVSQENSGALAHRALKPTDAWDTPETVAEQGSLPAYALGVRSALLLYWQGGELQAAVTDETYGGTPAAALSPEGFTESYLGSLIDQRDTHAYTVGLDGDGAPQAQYTADDAATWNPL